MYFTVFGNDYLKRTKIEVKLKIRIVHWSCCSKPRWPPALISWSFSSVPSLSLPNRCLTKTWTSAACEGRGCERIHLPTCLMYKTSNYVLLSTVCHRRLCFVSYKTEMAWKKIFMPSFHSLIGMPSSQGYKYVWLEPYYTKFSTHRNWWWFFSIHEGANFQKLPCFTVRDSNV